MVTRETRECPLERMALKVAGEERLGPLDEKIRFTKPAFFFGFQLRPKNVTTSRFGDKLYSLGGLLPYLVYRVVLVMAGSNDARKMSSCRIIRWVVGLGPFQIQGEGVFKAVGRVATMGVSRGACTAISTAGRKCTEEGKEEEALKKVRGSERVWGFVCFS